MMSLAVKVPPANAENLRMQIPSLGQEDPLEEGMATHCSIPAWRIVWTEKNGGRQSIGLQRVKHDWSNWTHTHTYVYKYIFYIGMKNNAVGLPW